MTFSMYVCGFVTAFEKELGIEVGTASWLDVPVLKLLIVFKGARWLRTVEATGRILAACDACSRRTTQHLSAVLSFTARAPRRASSDELAVTVISK